MALTGDPTSRTPYRRGSTAQICYVDLLDSTDVQPPTGQNPALGLHPLVVPSTQPITARIAAADHVGLSCWRVPTDQNGGGHPHRHAAITPILVVTPIDERQYQVLISTDAAKNTPTLEQPYLRPSGQNNEAGRLQCGRGRQRRRDHRGLPETRNFP